MSELGWEKVRAKVLLSDLKVKILEAVESFQVETEKKFNSYGMSISLKNGSKTKAEPKSQYRIAEDLGKKYASVVRALRQLEKYGVIISKSQDRKVTYLWTYMGILLLPDLASSDAVSSMYGMMFGNIDDFVDLFCQKLKASKQEAAELIFYLGFHHVKFLDWLREQIILPFFQVGEEQDILLPDLKNNEEYWRELSITFLMNHFTTFPPSEYASQIFECAKCYDANLESLKTGIQKLLRFGGKWFSEAEVNWVEKKDAVGKSN